jgi:hypothetical protein
MRSWVLEEAFAQNRKQSPSNAKTKHLPLRTKSMPPAESKSDHGANALAVDSALSCATGPCWGVTKGGTGLAGVTGVEGDSRTVG